MANAPQRGIPIELIGPQPRCFTEPQWMIWVASEAAPEGEADPDGFCSVCTSEYQAEMVKAGRCRYPSTMFTTDDHDIRGIRTVLARIPAVTLADDATSNRFREKIAPIIEAVKSDGPLSLRRQLFGPKNF